MEDIRLGRQLASIETQVTIDAAIGTPIAPADPLRTRMIIGGDTTSDIRFSTNKSAAENGRAFTVALANMPYVMRIEDWGIILTYPWFAVAPGGPVTASVVLTTLEKL